jgi:curved DNA-binding protein
MIGRLFVDYYEALQLSPNADLDTIQRVHRILAQRFHPDNQDSGDAEAFRAISDAYHELSDPERRAAYDVEHREKRRLTWRIFDQSNSAQGVDAERQKRHGVLALLYRKRTADREQPGVTIKEMEELLCVPKEHLEFALWFLKESQCVQRTDNARFTITLKGAEMAEDMITARPEATPVAFLTAARRTA